MADKKEDISKYHLYIDKRSIHRLNKNMDYVKITHDKLDINAINELICDAECGAISFFVGTTRNNFESKKVCYDIFI